MWSSSPSLDPICQAVTLSMIWELGQAYREYSEASEFFSNGCLKVSTLEERRQISVDFGDMWTEQAFSIPLMWVFEKAVVNPDVVEEYDVNMLHMGPVRYHESTTPVFK